MKSEKSFTIERTIVIRAERSTVFRYFTDSERFASWWGTGSTIEPKPGGAVNIRYPGNVTAGGAIVEIEPDARIVFTYGYDDPEKPILRGATRVTITLADHPEGTLLSFLHEVPSEATRDMHVAGWRFQLSLFANVVAREQHAGLDALVDRYFLAWAAPDRAACEGLLGEAVTENVSFHDPFACVAGRAELALHVEASKRHMGNLALGRSGASRQCQGTALVDWVASSEDGTPKARGTNVLTLAPSGKIAGIVGFWAEKP
jgi:uncharacterized protein YndB with AHSA1/START domain